MTKHEKAFLDTIAYAEGTLGVSQNGYDVVVTFKTIVGWTENTNIIHGDGDWLQTYNSKGGKSSAAGRYQFLGSTWKGGWVGGTKTKRGQNVAMTKDNQDIAALWLIKNARKVSDAEINDMANLDTFKTVIEKVRLEWASLPKPDGSGSYEGQGGNKSITELFEVFNKALALY